MLLDFYFQTPHPTRATSCTRIWTRDNRYCNVQHLNMSTSHGVILRDVELNYSNIQSEPWAMLKKGVPDLERCRRGMQYVIGAKKDEVTHLHVSICTQQLSLHCAVVVYIFSRFRKTFWAPFFQFLPILARNLRHRLTSSKSEIKGRKFVLNEIKISKYIITYLLTYSMEQSPSWEGNWYSAILEISRIIWNPKFHYRIHNYLPPVLILRLPDYTTS